MEVFKKTTSRQSFTTFSIIKPCVVHLHNNSSNQDPFGVNQGCVQGALIYTEKGMGWCWLIRPLLPPSAIQCQTTPKFDSVQELYTSALFNRNDQGNYLTPTMPIGPYLHVIAECPDVLMLSGLEYLAIYKVEACGNFASQAIYLFIIYFYTLWCVILPGKG